VYRTFITDYCPAPWSSTNREDEEEEEEEEEKSSSSSNNNNNKSKKFYLPNAEIQFVLNNVHTYTMTGARKVGTHQSRPYRGFHYFFSQTLRNCL